VASHYLGNLRRYFSEIASNTASQHRRSAQALLPHAQPCFCSLPVANQSLLLFANIVSFTRLSLGRPNRAPWGAKLDILPLKVTLFDVSRHIPLNEATLALFQGECALAPLPKSLLFHILHPTNYLFLPTSINYMLFFQI
jgi:hypothetical protein